MSGRAAQRRAQRDLQRDLERRGAVLAGLVDTARTRGSDALLDAVVAIDATERTILLVTAVRIMADASSAAPVPNGTTIEAPRPDGWRCTHPGCTIPTKHGHGPDGEYIGTGGD